MHTTTMIHLHNHDRLIPITCEENIPQTWCLRIGDSHHRVSVIGSFGDLQQFAARITAAVRDAIEAGPSYITWTDTPGADSDVEAARV